MGVTVSQRDLTSAAPWAGVSRRVIRRLDEAFVSDPRLAAQLRAAGARLATTVLPPVAAALPTPSARDQAAVSKVMRDVRPGRPVLAMIWPDSRNDLRWFRDAVMPALDGKPVCVVAGAPSRREARLLLGATGVRQQFRVLPGRLAAGRLSALVRWADVLVSPAGSRRNGDGSTDLVLTLAASGVPLVTDGLLEGAHLDHEHNALLVSRSNEREFAVTINRLLALPSVQRHYLGQEFARHTFETWPWQRAAETYAERFAALVGRPAIPAQLRAA